MLLNFVQNSAFYFFGVLQAKRLSQFEDGYNVVMMAGVRQDSVLSPTLLAVYINDINSSFHITKSCSSLSYSMPMIYCCFHRPLLN